MNFNIGDKVIFRRFIDNIHGIKTQDCTIHHYLGRECEIIQKVDREFDAYRVQFDGGHQAELFVEEIKGGVNFEF